MLHHLQFKVNDSGNDADPGTEWYIIRICVGKKDLITLPVDTPIKQTGIEVSEILRFHF